MPTFCLACRRGVQLRCASIRCDPPHKEAASGTLTKRKILLALGLKVSDKDRVFGQMEVAEASGSSDEYDFSGYRQ